ncbi:MAG: cysS [Gammaproteobacteria bacterium]|jgi:cysteinyl-tRNA synthetase|nr:cysS [Gammaproteobacteria bacterium]
MLKIYNSMTQKKEFFQPLHPGKINIYVCGPTVYDFCHIGNGRTYAVFDVIIRYLRWRGYEVTYVRNITDIDDKIIKRANDNKEAFSTVVERFTAAMHEDFSKLGLLSPDHEPRVTDYLPSIIRLIEKLINNNYAYVANNGDVYYDVRQFKNYGCLSHHLIDQLESGARVEISDIKRDPLDFVLWKIAKPGEPTWASPWGAGRPGWHIECSAMSMDLLGERFDLHGGGKDLIFPHHENEIAQSEAATQEKFVNIWMHAGYLQIEKEKMSKSLGNFFTIRDLLQNNKPEVLRYFMISSHYRSPVNYSNQALLQAHKALERFYNALRGLPAAEAPFESDFEKRFIAAMDDDFNTPVAFALLFELTHEIQRLRDKEIALAAQYGALLRLLGSVFGILQDDPDCFLQSREDTFVIETLISARNQARVDKNWAEADRIRAQLAAMSIEVEDTVSGTKWKQS